MVIIELKRPPLVSRAEVPPHLRLVVVDALAANLALVEAPLLEVGEELLMVHLARHSEEALAAMVVVPEVLTVEN